MKFKKVFTKVFAVLVIITGILFPSRVSSGTTVVMSLLDGDIVCLKCLGDVEGNRWLDGHTGDGTVDLAPATTDSYTGTRWLVHVDENGNCMLECLDHVGRNRWLDGHTGDGTVGLAPAITEDYTGTKWIDTYSYSDAALELCCVGNVGGNRWLDGHTGDGTVGLAPTTTGRYTGTKWRVYLLN